MCLNYRRIFEWCRLSARDDHRLLRQAGQDGTPHRFKQYEGILKLTSCTVVHVFPTLLWFVIRPPCDKRILLSLDIVLVLSTVPIKASICIALLRITNQKIYHYIIYAVIALSTIAAVITDIAVLAWCKPVSATWDPSLGSCADASLITNVSYYISATSILTDWTTAILPAVICKASPKSLQMIISANLRCLLK